METSRWQLVSSLIDEALEANPDRRGVLLRDRCGDDGSLREEVEDLLARMEREEPSPLDDSAIGLVAPELDETIAAPHGADRHPTATRLERGTHIGSYTLGEKIGEGGTSLVFRATRDDRHFTRPLAIKVLTATSVYGSVRERFDMERRLLASLAHPNVAEIFDGGVTPDELPYLVMEYVVGTPISEHVITRSLAKRERLELFIAVCGAVGHAHRRLVVHRDIKPANVLVREDGAVKLLDFGIAKLLDPELPGPGTVAPVTRAGLWLLTPTYAAPEQVRGEAVTTATDVFSLGVLFCEILSGRRPRDLDGLSTRQIVEVIERADVPEPSRRTGPGGLRPSELRGDLDAIVARATARDPAHRYRSAAELLEDVARHCRGDAVRARGRSRGYRARRWLARNALPVAIGAAATLAVLTALGLHTRALSAERDRAEAEAERARRSADFLASVYTLPDSGHAPGEPVTARELLDRAAARARRELVRDPALRAALLAEMSRSYEQLALEDRAIPLAEEALAAARATDDPGVPPAAIAVRLANLYVDVAEHGQADSLLRWARETTRRTSGTRNATYASVLEVQGLVAFSAGNTSSADSLFVETLRIRQEVLDENDPNIATVHFNLGFTRRTIGDLPAAERHFREALRIRRETLPRPNSRVAEVLRSLGQCLTLQGKLDEAEPLVRESLDEQLALFGPDHPRVAAALYSLGSLLNRRKRYEESIAAYERALVIRREHQPAHALNILGIRNNIANVRRSMGRFEEAVAAYRSVIDVCRAENGDEHVGTGIYRGNYANALIDVGAHDDAVREARESIRIVTVHFGAGSSRVASRQHILARALHARGDYTAADSAYAAAHATYVAASGDAYRARWALALDRARLLVDRGRAGDAPPGLEACIAHYTAESDTVQLLRARVWMHAARARLAADDTERREALADVRRGIEALERHRPESTRYLAEMQHLGASR